MVGNHEELLASTIEGKQVIPGGRAFYKMSGSGNDFVVVDARRDPPGPLAEPAVISRICARGTGVGADGIVFLERSDTADLGLVYLNADGSRAEFCGNATLCTTRLAAELGAGSAGGMSIETDSGIVQARLSEGLPEIDLQPVSDVSADLGGIPLEPGERRMGFAIVGVPHLVISRRDVAMVDVAGRSARIRAFRAAPTSTGFRWRTVAGGCAPTSVGSKQRRWRAAAAP